MKNNLFLKLQLSFTGFEKRMQQQLETCIAENASLLNAAKTIRDYNHTRPDIQIHYLTSLCDIDSLYPENSRSNNTRILCVGDFDDFESLLSCVQTGSYGCISVSNILTEIIPALISVLQNKIYVSASFATVVDRYFKKNVHQKNYAGLLTEREHRLIELLTTGALYKEIAFRMRISENTVRSHVRNVYGKLKVHSKTELTKKVLSRELIASVIYFITGQVACLCY